MLPQPLVEQFWQEVQQLLVKEHSLTRERARQAAAAYRHEVEPKAGEMLYHQDATEVATTIAAGVGNGTLLAS